MKASILFKLGLCSVPNSSRNKYFYQSLGASKGDLFLIKLLKFLRVFLPLLLIVVLVLYFLFPELWYNITHVYEVFRS
ncbi:hypothetical protein IJI72_01695 [Candidatus Saccharibacteria bacterium]|nr:hypothetical protein [Candidatus Saccharibacteria bacterium]